MLLPSLSDALVWLGDAWARLAAATRWLPTLAPLPGFIAGALGWWLVVGGVALLALVLQAALLAAPPWWGVPLLALLLKPAFAWRMLHDEVAAVGRVFGAASADVAHADPQHAGLAAGGPAVQPRRGHAGRRRGA